MFNAHMRRFLLGWALKAVAAGLIGWTFADHQLGKALWGFGLFLAGTVFDEHARWEASTAASYRPSKWKLICSNTADQALQLGLATAAFILTSAIDWLSFIAAVCIYLVGVAFGTVWMYHFHPTARQIRGETPQEAFRRQLLRRMWRNPPEGGAGAPAKR